MIALITIVDNIIAFFYMPFTGNAIYHSHSHRWARQTLFVSGINLKVIGGEDLDKSKSYIYVANHASLFDIPILLAGLDDNVCIMYKKELENIPVFGYGLRKSPFIPIVRANPRKAMESIKESLSALNSGDSMFIFPEGTRTKTGKMLDFKRGAFMIASVSGLPIVPVTIKGSYSIIPQNKKKIVTGEVTLTIHPAIENNERSRDEEKQFIKDVHDIIEKSL